MHVTIGQLAPEKARALLTAAIDDAQGYRTRDRLKKLDRNPFLTEDELAADRDASR